MAIQAVPTLSFEVLFNFFWGELTEEEVTEHAAPITSLQSGTPLFLKVYPYLLRSILDRKRFPNPETDFSPFYLDPFGKLPIPPSIKKIDKPFPLKDKKIFDLNKKAKAEDPCPPLEPSFWEELSKDPPTSANIPVPSLSLFQFFISPKCRKP